MTSSVPLSSWDYGKSAEGMKRLRTSLEPNTMELGVEQTAVDRFFVCSASEAPPIETGDWHLRVHGDACSTETVIDWQMLQSLPQRRVDAWLECAGNGREMYELVGGYQRPVAAEDTAWTLGAMGMASWTGVSLSDVLGLGAIAEKAAWIAGVGGDHDNEEGEPASMCLPLAKALDPDTIIATAMNGAPLRPAHGYPARLVVPGWIGAYSVKWLAELVVSSDWVPSWRADVYYRLRSADGTDKGPATAHPLKSCLALDWPAVIGSGQRTVRGYARSGHSMVERVEIQIDDQPWFEASITARLGRWGWVPFEFAWDAPPGAHTIRTRAWDSDGHTQPDAMDYHPNTILWHAVTAHPVTVEAEPTP